MGKIEDEYYKIEDLEDEDYDWDEDDNVVRFMCSFDTTESDIISFVDTLKKLLSDRK